MICRTCGRETGHYATHAAPCQTLRQAKRRQVGDVVRSKASGQVGVVRGLSALSSAKCAMDGEQWWTFTKALEIIARPCEDWTWFSTLPTLELLEAFTGGDGVAQWPTIEPDMIECEHGRLRRKCDHCLDREELSEAIADRDAEIERLRLALAAINWPSHYEHHDPTGGAGSGCPACHKQWSQREARDKALRCNSPTNSESSPSEGTPEHRTFASGAHRNSGAIDLLRYDLIPPAALRALARRFGIGVALHGEHNWIKGIPFSVMIYHVVEHLQALREGTPDDDEPTVDPIEAHGAAIMWAMSALIEYRRRGRSDLDDRLYCDRLPGKRQQEPQQQSDARVDYQALYFDLLMLVGNRFPGESRHDTARRYLLAAERPAEHAAKQAPGKPVGGEP